MAEEQLWTCSEFEIDNGYIWFVPININVLVKYDLKKKMVEKTFTWNEGVNIKGASYNVKKILGNITVIPARDNVMHIIDENENINDIIVDNKDTDKERYQAVSDCGDRSMCFPLFSDNIIVFHEDGQINYVPFELKKITQVLNMNSRIYLFNRGKELCWISPDDYNVIEENIDYLANISFAFKYDKNIIFLTGDGKAIMCKGENLSKIKEIANAPLNDFFSAGIFCKGKIILFLNGTCEMVCVYNIESDSSEFIETGLKKNHEWIFNAFSCPKVFDNKIWIFSVLSQELVRFNSDGVVEDRFSISVDEIMRDINNDLIYVDTDFIYTEDAWHSLDGFVQFINQ